MFKLQIQRASIGAQSPYANPLTERELEIRLRRKERVACFYAKRSDLISILNDDLIGTMDSTYKLPGKLSR
jgi:hypothetical protein